MSFFKLWMIYIQVTYWKNLDWVLLEVVPPAQVNQSPRAAENFFAGIWTAFGTVGTKVDKYIKGAMQEYYSFEIVGIDGHVHFFIRCLRHRRNHVEAQIYAHYPGVEIFEAEDYTEKIPHVVKSPDWDIWGTALKLSKEDAYPIRTYRDFIDLAPIGDESTLIDPVASIVETLTKLREGEQGWIHIYCRPTDDSWKNAGQKLMRKMMGTDAPPKRNAFLSSIDTVFDTFLGGGSGGGDSAPPIPKSFLLSEEDRTVMKAISHNISKPGYETKIQFAYIGKKDIFTKINGTAMMGLFVQFNDLTLNGLKPKSETLTRASYFFKDQRANFKKRLLYESLKSRKFFDSGFVFNTEELATLFHFPAMSVQAPRTPRVQAKKGTPPTSLPVG